MASSKQQPKHLLRLPELGIGGLGGEMSPKSGNSALLNIIDSGRASPVG